MGKNVGRPGSDSGRVFYLDFLRVVAMLAVIVLHTAARNFTGVELNSSNWHFINIYDSFVRWAVPVFTMVSGTMFLDNTKELPLKKLFGKYLLRIVIAFAVWSVVYCFAGILLGSKEFSISTCVSEIVRGHYHLWFLYMIAGLYLVTPLLRKITADRSMTIYFLIIAFVFNYLIQNALTGLEIFGGWIYEVSDLVINKKLIVKLVLGYSPYFVAGYLLHNTEINRKTEIVIYILGAIGFISTPVLTNWVSNFYGEAVEFFYRYYCINVLFESLAVFVFAKQHISRINNARFHNLIFRTAKLSFGVYLVHALVLAAFIKIVCEPSAFSTAISIPVISLAVFAVSLIASFVLNKIPIVNKYLV